MKEQQQQTLVAFDDASTRMSSNGQHFSNGAAHLAHSGVGQDAASPKSPPTPAGVMTPNGTLLPLVARQHDIVNLYLIGVLNVLNVAFLMGWTGGSMLYLATVGYFVSDIAFVAKHPACVKAPSVIITHHVAALGLMIIPILGPEYIICLGHCMLVEFNTWFLISKRTINILVPVQEALFYISWVVLRLIWYPYLLWDFCSRWVAKCQELGTYWNPFVIGPVMMVALVGLNVHWTLSLLLKKKVVRPKVA